MSKKMLSVIISFILLPFFLTFCIEFETGDDGPETDNAGGGSGGLTNARDQVKVHKEGEAARYGNLTITVTNIKFTNVPGEQSYSFDMHVENHDKTEAPPLWLTTTCDGEGRMWGGDMNFDRPVPAKTFVDMKAKIESRSGALTPCPGVEVLGIGVALPGLLREDSDLYEIPVYFELPKPTP